MQSAIASLRLRRIHMMFYNCNPTRELHNAIVVDSCGRPGVRVKSTLIGPGGDRCASHPDGRLQIYTLDLCCDTETIGVSF